MIPRTPSDRRLALLMDQVVQARFLGVHFCRRQAQRRQATLQPQTPTIAVLVSLAPSGALTMRAQHADGSRLPVNLPADPEKALLAIRAVLLAQEQTVALTGTAAAPTQWNVDQAGKPAPGGPTGRTPKYRTIASYPDGTKVRTLATRSRKIKPRVATLEELGLI